MKFKVLQKSIHTCVWERTHSLNHMHVNTQTDRELERKTMGMWNILIRNETEIFCIIITVLIIPGFYEYSAPPMSKGVFKTLRNLAQFNTLLCFTYTEQYCIFTFLDMYICIHGKALKHKIKFTKKLTNVKKKELVLWKFTSEPCLIGNKTVQDRLK